MMALAVLGAIPFAFFALLSDMFADLLDGAS
jgi:hypothetical protein